MTNTPMKKGTILCIEDDQELQFALGIYLDDSGYLTLPAYGGGDAISTLTTQDIDIVLLDLTLPDIEGLELLPKIRKMTKAPVIIVSGKDDTTERVIGLEMGADDYITKPFEMRELVARIKAVRRRTDTSIAKAESEAEKNDNDNDNILFGNWRLDRLQYQLYTLDGTSAGLTAGEFRLLEALALSPNRVLTRDHLFEITRAMSNETFDRAVDIQIGRIRKKIRALGDDTVLIKTVRGVGYMFSGLPVKKTSLHAG